MDPTKSLIKPLPSVEYLRECFTYCGTGQLIWNKRPRHHYTEFASPSRNMFVGRYAGTPHTSTNGDTRHLIKLRQNGVRKTYFRARIVWTLFHGVIPNGFVIDHADGDSLNDQIGNLRLATYCQNAWNICKTERNTSGVKGISWSAKKKTWRIEFTANKQKIRLGYEKDYDTAVAKISLHRRIVCGEFANNGAHYGSS